MTGMAGVKSSESDGWDGGRWARKYRWWVVAVAGSGVGKGDSVDTGGGGAGVMRNLPASNELSPVGDPPKPHLFLLECDDIWINVAGREVLSSPVNFKVVRS